jgi:hypothetical protein
MTDSTQAPVGPVAGWYPDPYGQPILRWWDGSAWREQTQAAPPPGGAAPPPGWETPSPPPHGVPFAGTAGPYAPASQPQYRPVAPARAPAPWAWCVAAAPVILLAVAAVAAALGGPSPGVVGYIWIGNIVATVLTVFMAYRDARALKVSGELAGTGLAWWSLLTPWAYLWARAVKKANRTNGDWGLLAASLTLWVLVIVIATPLVSSVATANAVFDRAKVQAAVAKGIQDQSGIAVNVNCPQNPPMNPGTQFQCVATAKDGSRAFVTITVQGKNGGYTWRVG